jgi:succinate dehydrogenase flavin-adding protein (antitoxin of CptAB toxin-antitoxin module)
MQELDTLLSRYLETYYGDAAEDHKRAFAEILEMQDPELWSLLVGRTVHASKDINDIVKLLQQPT